MELKNTADIPEGKVVDTLVTRPDKMFDSTIRYVRKLEETIVPWPMPLMDKFFVPIYHGQYILMQGRPGDAKTSLGIAIANMFGAEVKRRGPDFPYGNPLFVTAETTKQHMSLYLAMERLNAMGKLNSVTGKAWNIEDVHRGTYKHNELMVGAMKLTDLNVDLLGQDAELIGQSIDIELIFRAVQELEKVDKRPLFIVMDYAQKLDAMRDSMVHSRNDKDAAIFSQVDQFTVATGIPVILMAQSNEYVDDWEIPIGAAGSVHGSSLAHRYAHAHFALCRPWRKKQWRTDNVTGERPLWIDTKLGRYPNKANLQLIRDLKQRGKDPETGIDEIGFFFNPGGMTIEEIPEDEVSELDFNDAVNYDSEELKTATQSNWHLA